VPPRRLPDFDRGAPSTLTVGGETIGAFERESVAVALFASGASVLSRSLKYHRPRSFFCLEGHCGGCLMRIGGLPNQRACMEPCADGATVAGQNAYPSPDMDVLAAVDWMFPDGMNHHTLMTGSRLLNRVANKVVRQLSGLGLLPQSPTFGADDAELVQPDVLVIGGGPAGLAAAREAAAAGAHTLLCDEQDAPGGSLLADPRHGPGDAAARAAEALRAGARLESRATAIGYFPEDGGGVVAIATPRRLLVVRARAVVHATGGYAQNRAFANNDRPGVVAARAVGRLLVRYGVVPAERICLVGGDGAEADYAAALARALAAAGCDVTAIDPRHHRVVGARGRAAVRALEVSDAAGNTRRIACDLIAVAAPPAPASEAARQHGCAVELRPRGGGFAVVVDQDGRTSMPGVFACGDVCGATTPALAAETGARVGRAAAAEAAP
jgi:sarcosine oxidase subunit alpha